MPLYAVGFFFFCHIHLSTIGNVYLHGALSTVGYVTFLQSALCKCVALSTSQKEKLGIQLTIHMEKRNVNF